MSQTINIENNDDIHLPNLDIPNKKPAIKSKRIPFWSENPNVLLDQRYILEFFPVESMTYEQKLNSVTRTVIVLTIITFIYTKNTRLLAVSAVTILAIFLLFYSHQQMCQDKKRVRFGEEQEGFTNLDSKHSDVFVDPTAQNPMSNVLITDYEYNPNRKPAPASYTEKTGGEILKQAKQMVIDANPGQPDIAKKLFTDLADEFEFEQSMRPFHSTANTTIPNDQGSFADFCYGSMVSCKEGNMFACARNDMARYNNY